MYKCLIVDDNEIERDAIVMHVSKIPSLKIIAVCQSGIEAYSVLEKNEVDIVFSDIDMPGLSGTELLKSIKKQPQFIFITSYSEYASEGFNLDAIDFIVKPATFERILKAATKAIEYLDLKKLVPKSNEEKLIKIDPATAEEDIFYFRESKGTTKMRFSDLLYIESMGDFSKLYTIYDKNVVVLVSLKSLENQFPKQFIRVHKQYMINLNHLVTITNHEVHLTNNYKVPINLASRQELLNTINKKTINRFSK